MPYDQIVFIGYVLDTTPKKNFDGTFTYLGVEPPAVDIAARCELLAAAMEAARVALPAPSSPPLRTLKVFMIPEFFFRGPSPGAYDMPNVQLAIAALQELAAHPQWEDWVFEFGTVLGRWAVEDPNRPVQICNFAPVQQGGMAAQGPDGARVIVKELKSGVDFIAANANPGGYLVGEVEYEKGAAKGPGSERQRANYDGAGIFDMLDLTWAAEICRDHLLGRLQGSPLLPGETRVQIQLIPSCGASIKEAFTIAQTGGYVFNVDGWRDNEARAALVKAGTPPEQMPRAKNVPLTTVQVTVPVSPPRTIAVDALYAGGAGSIWTYAPVPVPPVQRVPGATDRYVWKASVAPSWTFTFYLIYGDNGLFERVLCQINSTKIDFMGNKYTLPFQRDLTFPPQPPLDLVERPGSIDIQLRAGGTYTHAVFAKIQVPGFNFEGDILRFMAERNSPKPIEHIWR